MSTTAVITGATSGIGLATAKKMAQQGIITLGIGRDAGRCEAARQTILDAFPQAKVEYLLCDLSSQSQIRKLAQEITTRYESLDILINAAGAVSSYFMTSEDGIEMQLAVDHLAPFLLTHELLPLLMKSSMGRVVTVSSGSHYGAKLNFNDLQMRKRYSCLGQYKHVKLCNVIFTAELNRRLGAQSTVKAFAAHPGLVRTEIGLKDTSGIEKLVWKLRMKSGVDPSVPAETIYYLATEHSLLSSHDIYWYNKEPKQPNPYALRKDAAKQLWEASERLCRIRAE
jgi:NAD(P)-dependent dehydrogenase (short-subunit alcohol dehydrogenase family)